ncbi:sigma-70 family RNA polymerase sigma factor [Acidithiobacillus ferrooxidans]|nr:sigma-70 family RNA polymerase sigma factor [Acidithiobacillus ferrooxidans]
MDSDDLNRLLIRWIAGEDSDDGVAVVIYPFLLRVAARMADSASRRGYSLEADDMAQDLWLSILRAKNAGLLKSHSNPVAWIWVRSNFVLGHNTRSPLRKAMVGDMDFERLDLHSEEDPPRAAEDAEIREEQARAMARLRGFLPAMKDMVDSRKTERVWQSVDRSRHAITHAIRERMAELSWNARDVSLFLGVTRNVALNWQNGRTIAPEWVIPRLDEAIAMSSGKRGTTQISDLLEHARSTIGAKDAAALRVFLMSLTGAGESTVRRWMKTGRCGKKAWENLSRLRERGWK